MKELRCHEHNDGRKMNPIFKEESLNSYTAREESYLLLSLSLGLFLVCTLKRRLNDRLTVLLHD